MTLNLKKLEKMRMKDEISKLYKDEKENGEILILPLL